MDEILSKIAEFFDTAWGVVEFLIDGLLEFIDVITSIPTVISSYLSFLPTEVITAFLGIITVVVAYKIVGRD